MAAASFLSAAGRRLEGKVAIITGGASGIGKSSAQLFTEQGAKVVIADIQDDLGRSVAHSLGPTSSYVHCDVSDEAQIQSLVDKTVAAHEKLDIMFNNAGILGAWHTRALDTEKPEFERVMSVNACGAFLGIKHAARVMIPKRAGSIISTSSLATCLAGIAPHAYTASKHALVGLTRNAAIELGRFGIRVNCVSPYGVATSIGTETLGIDVEAMEHLMSSEGNLKGVTLEARDIANAALFLASEEARYISGVNLPVDGGVSIYNSSFQIFSDE